MPRSLAAPEPTLAGWGRLSAPGREVLAEDLESLTRGAVLSRGLGRSYGDSSIPARVEDRVAATRLANRILSFDEATGVIRTEAGLSLAELNRLECGPALHADLFDAAIGGMGLLGHILEVEFVLRRIASPWILMESERVHDIDAYLEALERGAAVWPMTMGWIDCLNRGRSMGRGIFMAGRRATPELISAPRETGGCGRPAPACSSRSA